MSVNQVILRIMGCMTQNLVSGFTLLSFKDYVLSSNFPSFLKFIFRISYVSTTFT